MQNPQNQKFTDVLKGFKLSAPISGVFSDCIVKSVSLNKSERKLKFDIESGEIIAERSRLELEKALLGCMPFVNGVEINVKYKMENRETALNSFWGCLVEIIGAKHPLGATILKDSSWNLSGGELCINFAQNGSFIFMRNGLDKKVEKLVNESFGYGIRVKCEDLKMPEGAAGFGGEDGTFVNTANAFAQTSGAQNGISAGTAAQNGASANTANHSAQISGAQKSVSASPAAQGSVSVRPAAASKAKNSAKGASKPASSAYPNRGKGGRSKKLKIAENLKGVQTGLNEELIQDDSIFFKGKIIDTQAREIKTGSLVVTFDITDFTNSVTVKFFTEPETYKSDFKDLLKVGENVAVNGLVRYDAYSGEINITPVEIAKCEAVNRRADNAAQKRVELHLHTQMSSMDAVTHVSEYIKRAAEWGHKAIAVTDHGVVQAFPDAMAAAEKHGVKVIYGMEAYLADDLQAVVTNEKGQRADGDFVFFDIETTGLKPELCKIIEIGAARVVNFEITETFNTMVDPEEPIPYSITQLTGIKDEDVAGQPKIKEALEKFFAFAKESVLGAHNASFDTGFIACHARKNGMSFDNTVLDTLGLSRGLYPDLKKHTLESVSKHLEIDLENHHRAYCDASACAQIYIKSVKPLYVSGTETLAQLNSYVCENLSHKTIKHNHAVILVKNAVGLRNLYELVSEAHLKYFYKRPRILKSRYNKLREGLLIGTACEAGEFYRALRDNAGETLLNSLAEFYDYFEIQPNGNNMYMVRDGLLASEDDLIRINKKIISYAEKFNKPVVATCDVHFLEPQDEVIRRILMHGEGYKDTDNQPPLFYRTTEEMLREFSYLGEEKAREVVITNTNLIADMTEAIKPIPDGTFPPVIEGAEEEIKELATKNAEKLYGCPLPEAVSARLERELDSIIKNGFSVMYLIAQKLVKNSEENGYLVGSRGSVGSSFVATMTGITEVNPLSAHYLCPNCKYSDFTSDAVLAFSGGSGCDMPDKTCPVCANPLKKEGHDIPFETFLGFDGDKEPDIDLNFSGEFQARAHAYTEELFGKGHVFKAGTIGTLADKNAYGAVKKYLDEKEITLRGAEINRLKLGCVGIKKTTGQHPGGLMIVPKGKSIYEFCPVQRPANDADSSVTTTHFDYHSISGRLLKLDLLGHDVPTIIRMLHVLTGVNPQEIDLGRSDVISLFTSPSSLGVTEGEIGCKTGSLGLPEFGTSFVRQMLQDTQPKSFAELVRISGLSHGTNVWLNNAQDIIKSGEATLKTIIPTRDDIMLYLISMGVEKKTSFKIMENVRKGKGLSDSDEETMRKNNVPQWYIDSCKKIEYLFPKGHAVAYVMMTIRIGYYKIHHPYAFYAAVLSVKAEDFDYETMCFGKEKVVTEINRLNSLGKDEITAKEKNSLTILELALEMYARGLKFTKLDLYSAQTSKFSVTEAGLMAPLCSVAGLGLNAAQSIVDARENGEFSTIEDFGKRTKVNKSVMEILKRVGVLDGMPETNQLSLFDLH
ncbi:MAG: PolC-type DNA polymerase III [Clostridiales bacterium]|nr:PolC-type DNA polymerase III [Clostridiales bacterium]